MRARVLVATIVLALALPSAAARAGSYDVTACATTNGGAQNAFIAAVYPGMSAYLSCPNTPSNPASGMVTRASATAGPGTVPMLAGAYQVFEAPPGASLASVSFDVAVIRLASYWTTGIVAFDNNFDSGSLPYGCYAGSPGCSIGSQSFFGPVTVGLGGHSKFRFETRCGNPSGCDISGSGFQPGTRALFSAANVVVRVNDFSAPSITPVSGSLWSGGWQRGVQDAWQMLSDNVGIMMLRLYADGRLADSQDFRQPRWPDHVRCDFTRRQPCSPVLTGGMYLDTRTVPDGARTIRVETVDAAGNSAQVDRTVLVDNTPPPPATAAVAGGEGWRQSNGFVVRWGPSSEEGSPVAKIHYSLCRAAAASQCSQGVSSAPDDRSLHDLSVPAPGEYSLRLWLEDAAGNVEPANASPPVRLRFDDVAPHAAFLGLDDHDPLKLELPVSDQGSGLESGVIEMRRVGWRQWQELETAVGADRLVARIDDDLPDGAYELRAAVRDRAGNERTTDRRMDGSRMELTLPLRNPSRITVQTATRCQRGRRGRSCRRRAARRSGVVDGNRKTVLGRLDAGGRPLAGAQIGVYEQSRIGGTRRTGTLETDSSGHFRHQVGSGPSRTLRYRYEGTPRVKPADARMTVVVRARTVVTVSRRHLRNGDTVRFSGRLLGGPVPDGGKLIDLQAHYRRQWRTFATPRTDASGRWQQDYRFEATRGLVRYRFRARIRREAAYPYELGYSRVLSVIVRGP